MYEALVKRLRAQADAERYFVGEDMLYDKAADAIEELSATISKMEIATRWIPVTEQLIHSGWYLVACNEWGGSAVRKAIYDEATRKWLEFPCGGPKNITKFVTHWMHLPEPPEEES